MKKGLKFISLIIVILMINIMIIGCSSETDEVNQNKEDVKLQKNEINQNQKEINLPLKEKETLTFWCSIDGDAAKVLTNYGDAPLFQELEKCTNVHIDFIHPPVGQEKEKFSLLLASAELPDIIMPGEYPGGPDKAIEEGVYLKLNELIDKYAPNYKNLRQSNKEIARQTITDEGNIWAFSCIQEVEEPAWCGLTIREDYLKKFNLQSPTTIDEWEHVLTVFKDNGIKSPLHFPLNKGFWGHHGAISSAYGVGKDWIKVDGKIKYSPLEHGYKEFLTTMHQWYEKGLLDKDFATRDRASFDAAVTNGEIAAFAKSYGYIDIYMNMMKDDSNFQLIPVPSPTLNKGDTIHYRQTNPYNKGYHSIVSGDCKKPELAVKWLDYGYGDEGFLSYNYGIEGKSYKIVDGKPVFTELMTNNPEGMPYMQMAWLYKQHMGSYKRDYAAAPMVDKPVIKQCMKVWSNADNDYVVPPLSLNYEESKKYSEIMTDINTLVEEMRLKYVMGVENVDNYDDFIKQLKNMGIDEAISIQQKALDRYYNR